MACEKLSNLPPQVNPQQRGRSMEYRTLGNSDLQVSSIVVGTAFRGGLVDEMPRVISRALELGINIFDTGEYVRNGVVTEEVLGRAIKGRRQGVMVAVKMVPPATRELELRLRRLQTDYIDLLEILPCRCDVVCKSGYAEHVDEPHYSVAETMMEAEKLVARGVVRYLGVSRYTTEQLREAESALTSTRVLTDQLHYNVIATELGDGVMPYCREHDVTIMAYSPLGAGLLLGNDDVAHDRLERYGIDTQEKLGAYRELNAVLTEIAADRGRTAAQVVLNWTLSQDRVMPIIGPDQIAHVDENCAAAGWRLAPEELTRIDAAAANLRG